MRKIQVLIVEHDAATRELITSAVRDWGYEPIVADTGEDAFLLVETRRPDLVVVDPRLRDGDRFDLVRHALARGARVLLMSAFFDKSVAEELGVAFLAKPFAFDELQRHVRGTGT